MRIFASYVPRRRLSDDPDDGLPRLPKQKPPRCSNNNSNRGSLQPPALHFSVVSVHAYSLAKTFWVYSVRGRVKRVHRVNPQHPRNVRPVARRLRGLVLRMAMRMRMTLKSSSNCMSLLTPHR